MRFPVAMADFVADERIARCAVRDAQQRFGQTHERDAFLAGQGKFLNQSFDTAAGAFFFKRFDQLDRQFPCLFWLDQ